MGTDQNYVYVQHSDVEAVERVLDELLEDPVFAAHFTFSDCEPERNGWCLVLDGGESGNPIVAGAVSERLNCVAASVWIYDSDVWGYELFDRGRLVDSHTSDAEYLELLNGDGVSAGIVPVGSPVLIAPYVRGGLKAARDLFSCHSDMADDDAARFVELLIDGPDGLGGK